MTTQTRRVAVFGAGWGTRVSVPAFRAAGWEVVGLWSRHPERAKEEAERLGIPSFTSDADALFSRDDVDAVAMHTPPGTHLELCRRALDAGKHVLLDKPFTMNAAEAEALYAAAEASGLVAMTNFEFRFLPLRRQITDLLAEGAIGRFRHAVIESHMSNPLIALGRPWRLDPAAGGGVLNELGSHAIDRVHQWFGAITQVSANLASFPPPGIDPPPATEDWFSATFGLRNGGVVTQTISWVTDPPQDTQITIVGSDGVLTARSPGAMLIGGEITIARSGEDALTPIPPPADQQDFAGGNGAVEASRRLIAAFERGIEDGVSPAPNFRDGLRSQIVIDAIRESAANGRRVEIAP